MGKHVEEIGSRAPTNTQGYQTPLNSLGQNSLIFLYNPAFSSRVLEVTKSLIIPGTLSVL